MNSFAAYKSRQAMCLMIWSQHVFSFPTPKTHPWTHQKISPSLEYVSSSNE